MLFHMRYFSLLTLAVALVSCKPDPPEPPKEKHFYDVNFRCIATNYPIAITASIGDQYWRDTVQGEMDTTLFHIAGGQRVTLQGFAYLDPNARMRVSIAYDYWNGTSAVYPPSPIAQTALMLPD